MLVLFLEQDVADPSCMGKDKGTGHVVGTVHGCISACLGLVHPSKHGAVGKSSSSASLGTYRKESSVRWQAICCSIGEDCSTLPWRGMLFVEEFSSSLNVKQ